MRITYEGMKCGKFEDEHGNPLTDEQVDEADYVCYSHVATGTVCTELSEYCYHPKNFIVKWLMSIDKKFQKMMLHKYRDKKTFKHIATFSSTYGSPSGQECIRAMVDSGEFTLVEAEYVYSHACERCMNVLLDKYTGKDGYKEFSDQWYKAGTECDFCRGTGEVHLATEHTQYIHNLKPWSNKYVPRD